MLGAMRCQQAKHAIRSNSSSNPLPSISDSSIFLLLQDRDQLGSELVTMATAAVTHAWTPPPLAYSIISYSFSCLSCPLKRNVSGLIM